MMFDALNKLGTKMGIIEPDKETIVQEPLQSISVSTIIPVNTMVSTGNGAVNQEMYGIITGAINSFKTVYSTFKETADRIAGVIADEATRFKTAAATIGTNRFELIDGIKKYDAILEQQKNEFAQNIANTLGTNSRILKTDIEALDAEISDLNNKLSVAMESKLKKETERSDTEIQIANLSRDFEVTLTKIKSDLDNECKKIEAYIVEVPK